MFAQCSAELTQTELEQIYEAYLQFCSEQGQVDLDKLMKVPFLTEHDKLSILGQEVNKNNQEG